MNYLPLTYAPHPIFKRKALKVDKVDDEIRLLIDKMLKTLYINKAIGLGANMVGILKRIAIVDLQKNSVCSPQIFINPEIIWYSEELQTFKEASICFPGIEAEIKRPRAIRLSYLDYDGNEQELEAEGFLATVIQHEIDYLDGKVFLDYLSKLKRDTLMKKMDKYMKLNIHHVHDEYCSH